jgi:hypothetical protein
MSNGDTREEIMARMQARRKKAMKPKRLRNFIIYVVVVGGMILAVNYYTDNMFAAVIDSFF